MTILSQDILLEKHVSAHYLNLYILHAENESASVTFFMALIVIIFFNGLLIYVHKTTPQA